jgi:soluble lytic murein transglycosylase-like protein
VIRLTVLTDDGAGETHAFGGELTRIGRAADCELRFGADATIVSNHHAHIVRGDAGYLLVDAGSTNGTSVNGEVVLQHLLATGDTIRFGLPDGPEVRVELVGAPAAARVAAASAPTERAMPALPDPATLVAAGGGEGDAATAAPGRGRRDSTAVRLTDLVVRRITDDAGRLRAPALRLSVLTGVISGTVHEAADLIRLRTRRRWLRVVAGVATVALVVTAALGGVIYWQHLRMASLLAEKARIDGEIERVQRAMQGESDPARLASLEATLTALTGSAERAAARIGGDSAATGAPAAGDPLDRDLRAILAKFDANTYAIPPIFRERVQYHIDELVRGGGVRTLLARRREYWPMITREFAARGLPEEMAYIAWNESQFDPTATSDAGARGMWQMTATTAQALGLRVDATVDERLDPEKQTRAAARHLANLLGEFGEESFMLAMASYNRGEEGVRRVLREVAQEPGGFRKEKRDFWHLYRLKKLPEETREYVPKVLAAAIVSAHPERYGAGTAPPAAPSPR